MPPLPLPLPLSRSSETLVHTRPPAYAWGRSRIKTSATSPGTSLPRLATLTASSMFMSEPWSCSPVSYGETALHLPIRSSRSPTCASASRRVAPSNLDTSVATPTGSLLLPAGVTSYSICKSCCGPSTDARTERMPMSLRYVAMDDDNLRVLEHVGLTETCRS